MTVIELRQQRAQHWEAMKDFLNKHEQKNGTLSVDDTATYENMEAELDRLNAAIDRAEKAEKLDAQMQKATSKPLTGDPGKSAIDTGRGSEAYKKAFLNFLRTRRASNALQEDTNSEGGYLVPVEFERTLFEARDKVDPIFSLAGRLSLGAKEKNVPYVSTIPTAALIAEEGTYGTSDAAFGQVVLRAYKFGVMTLASEELLNDSAFDLMGFLANVIGKAIGKAEAGYFWTGTGTSQPQGVMAAAGSGVTTALANKITADELIDLFYSVPEEYRSTATWAMNGSTVKELRKLKLGTGEYLWSPGFSGEPSTILGRPLVTSDKIDTIAATKKVIAFGDFNECYKIADRQGVELKVLNELYAATGQIGFRGSARTDGKGILASTGIKVLTMHS